MTKAFECDRCGELYGEPPSLKVATNGVEEPAGGVKLEKVEVDRAREIGSIPKPRSVPNAKYRITKGDLCEDCADAFREFWGGLDE